jgi:phosphatidylinositol 4-kinase
MHIDFGFIFDWSPGKDMRLESVAFKFSQEYIDILGGSPKAPAFRLFE